VDCDGKPDGGKGRAGKPPLFFTASTIFLVSIGFFMSKWQKFSL
jgi:hypothetical protein